MIPQPIHFDPKSEKPEPLQVRCPACGVRANHGCVSVAGRGKANSETLWARGDAEIWGTPIKTIHSERTARARKYHEIGIKWPCGKEGCDGWRYPVDSHDMLSSTEGVCNKCPHWISEPSNCITMDEMYESMLDGEDAAKYLDENELYDNPKAPKTGMEMAESASSEPIFLSRKRTKPIEYNPARRARLRAEESICPECGFNNHRWSNIVEASYRDRSKPCGRCGASFPT